MSKAYIVVGGTGTGKTTTVKEMISKVPKRNLFINDVNNEYTDFFSGEYMDVEEFTDLASRLKNAVIVFEEATIFFGPKGNDVAMRDILVRKRHTNNTVILVFHSLRSVPAYIYELVNYIIVLKTQDNAKRIEQKFDVPELVECYDRVKANKDPHYKEIFEVQGNIMHT